MNSRMTHPFTLQTVSRVVVPLAFIWGSSIASAVPDLDEALKKFQVDLPAASSSSVITIAGNDSLRAAQGQVVQLNSYLAREDYKNALNQARQFLADSSDPEIRKLWSDLLAAIRAKQKSVEDAQITQIMEALKTAGSRLLAASKVDEVDAIVDELYAVQDNVQNNYEPRMQRARNKLSSAISFCHQWQTMLELAKAGELEDARHQFQNFVSNSSGDRLLSRTEIVKRGRELNLDNADPKVVSAEADALVAKARDIALKATRSSELEPVMIELEDFRQNYNRYSGRINRITSRVGNVISFFQRWQDALEAVERGNLDHARQQFRNLATSGYSHRPVTRQQIIAKASSYAVEDSPSDNLLDGATLDNLGEYRDRIVFAQEMASGRLSSQLSNSLNEIERFISATDALKKGLAGDGLAEMKASRSTCGSRTAGNLEDTLGALKSEWFARALPALTGIKELPAFAKDENTLAYVRRQFDAAIEAGDWDRAYRFARVEHGMQPQSSPCAVREQTTGADPRAALGAWLDGNLMEQAAQPAAAAELYREALKAGAPPKLQTVLIAKLRELAAATEGAQ